MPDLVIYGTGAVAKVAFHYFNTTGKYSVRAFTDADEFIETKQFMDTPLVPFSQIGEKFSPQATMMFVAVGYAQTNKIRARVVDEVSRQGYELVSYVSPAATIMPGVEIGLNTSVGANCAFQPEVKVGLDVIIRENVFIGHNATIGDHCFVAAGAAIAGGSSIGAFTTIGMNAVIREYITIGERCIIGAGVTILKDTGDGEIFMSKPEQKLPFGSDFSK